MSRGHTVASGAVTPPAHQDEPKQAGTKRDNAGWFRRIDRSDLPVETGDQPAILDIAVDGGMSYRLHRTSAEPRLAA